MSLTETSDSPWVAEENAAMERNNAVVDLLRWAAGHPDRPHADDPRVDEWLHETINRIRKRTLSIELQREMALLLDNPAVAPLLTAKRNDA